MSREWIALPLAACLMLGACHKAEADEAMSDMHEARPAKPKPAQVISTVVEDPIRPGIYGDVHDTEETGDLLGAEIEIHGGPRHIVEMTLCEGACGPIVRTTYAVEQGAIRFIYRQPLANGDGTAARDLVIRLHARPDGKGVKLGGMEGGPVALRRLTRRHGLDVAARLEKETAALEN
jgi:hypothetical protein